MLEKGWVNKQEEQDDFQREQAVETPREASCWPGGVGPVGRDPGDRSTVLSSYRTASQERPHHSFITPNSQYHSDLPTIRETPQQRWGDRQGWGGDQEQPQAHTNVSPGPSWHQPSNDVLPHSTICSAAGSSAPLITLSLLKRLSADWKSSWQILC